MLFQLKFVGNIVLFLSILPRFHCDTNDLVEEVLVSVFGNVTGSSYDPELDMTTPEIIRHRGYPAEIHHVTTADGYILELHRIPFGQKDLRYRRKKYYKTIKKPVVYLQHGLLCSSSDWVLNPTLKGLAFMLADRGYDVWMGNARGNTYSRKHIFINENDEAFWKFSWDEMGYYDIPAELNYVLQQTGQSKLIYIGHSMGTTMFWVAMASHPFLNEKIELMVALAPVASVAHMKSPIKLLAPFVHQLQLLFRLLGTRALLPSGKLVRMIEKYVCDQTKWEADLCENFFFLLSGSDPENFNKTMLPLITAHTPAGTSTYTVIHYAQQYTSKETFSHFDWGPKGNIEKYGQRIPPEYNLTAVTAPVMLFWGENDWLATPKDVTWLAKRLGNLQGFFRVNLTEFNHLDFLWATNVDKLLYNQLVEMLPHSQKLYQFF